MTPTEQAARVLANCPRYDSDGDPSGQFDHKIFVKETDALAAIARHLAPGDDLVAQATAALEGVTEGPWAYEYTGIGHTVRQPGAYNAIFTVNHAGNSKPDARFTAWCREGVPALLARISALTATVGELEAEMARRIEMHECAMSERDDATLYADEQKARAASAEAEATTLRDRLARMEGAQKLREEIAALEKLCDHDCDNEDCVRCFHYPEILEQKRKQLTALTDGGKDG